MKTQVNSPFGSFMCDIYLVGGVYVANDGIDSATGMSQRDAIINLERTRQGVESSGEPKFKTCEDLLMNKFGGNSATEALMNMSIDFDEGGEEK